MTFASKSSVGPSYVANRQEDHKTYTNLNDYTVILLNDCYFDSIAQCMGVLLNVPVYCAMSKVKIDPYEINSESIAQCLNVLHNVDVYCAMFRVKDDPYELILLCFNANQATKHVPSGAESDAELLKS